MSKIAIGRSYRFRPSAFVQEKNADKESGVLTGRIVYIHPKRRFFTVEAEIHGMKISESFKITKANS